MEKLTQFFKAVSDPTRLRILVLLGEQDYCVCELTQILNSTQPKVSKHLAKLRDMGFVSTHRDAQFVRYHLTLGDATLKAIHSALFMHRNKVQVLSEDTLKAPNCLVK